MNNEPVAWINTRISDERPFLDWEKTEEQNYLSIPLYTHPAKTLTDEEFDNIFANGKRLGVLETEDRFRKAKTLTDEEIQEVTYLVQESLKLLRLSRENYGNDDFQTEAIDTLEVEVLAILRKASEK